MLELVVAKGEIPKLQASKPGGCMPVLPDQGPPAAGQRTCGGFVRGARGRVEMDGVTMGELCAGLSLNAGRDVIGKTEVAGVYNLHLDLSMDQVSSGPGTSRRQPPTRWRERCGGSGC